MKISDADRVLLVIGDEPWRACADIDGKKIIGAPNAIRIREALRKEGFVIVRSEHVCNCEVCSGRMTPAEARKIGQRVARNMKRTKTSSAKPR